MKKPIRGFAVSLISFYTVVQFIPGIGYGHQTQNLLIAGCLFAFFSAFIAPVLKVLLLPFNFLTFGGISAVINLGLIYSLTFFLPFFVVSGFNFPGFNLLGFVIPAFYANLLLTLVITSFGVGFFSSVLTYLFS